MTTKSCRVLYQVRMLGIAVAWPSVALALAMLGSVLLDTSSARSAEDIFNNPKYDDLRQVLEDLFPGTAVVVITQVANGEAHEVAVFDSRHAGLVPKGVANKLLDFSGDIQSGCDVPVVTFSASPACKLKRLPDGDQVWTPDPPCPE